MAGTSYYTPQKQNWEYIGITLSVCPSVRLCNRVRSKSFLEVPKSQKIAYNLRVLGKFKVTKGKSA